ncbi:MAG: hypothetical protein ABI378_01730 [Chitinophagaceae bacterium]
MSNIPKALLLFFIGLLCFHPSFSKKKKEPIKGNTEKGFINKLEGCLANKDAYCYISLWPDMDTLSKTILEYADKSSPEYKQMLTLQDNPVELMHVDSVFKANLKKSFDDLIADGEGKGIHWETIIPQRYELIKLRETRNTLNEKLAPTRFVGYLFFGDLNSGRSYALQVGEILQIKNEWYGGRLGEVFEGTTRDEWEQARKQAIEDRKHPKPTSDSATIIVPEAEQEAAAAKPLRQIVDRKFYAGMFDNDIPVTLYIRSLRGDCPGGVCAWEAIYKFGDQDGVIPLEVTKSEDGKWHFTEIPANAVMELSLKEGVLTGTWLSADDQTGYDVKLTELPASAKKTERLDRLLEQALGKH